LIKFKSTETLLRYNTLITEKIYRILGIVPEFISTYNSRKNAFPHLVQPNNKGKHVLFGGYPKDCDKKMIIWELAHLLLAALSISIMETILVS